MTDETFGEYMGEQVSRIRDFKRRLEEKRGESLSLEEAARAWVRRYAETFRRDYREDSEDGADPE